jgi:hypothetical protein
MFTRFLIQALTQKYVRCVSATFGANLAFCGCNLAFLTRNLAFGNVTSLSNSMLVRSYVNRRC